MTSLGPDVTEYRVGWICAVQTEYTIACALLDQEYPAPPNPPHDENIYTCGRIGHHNVVIACLPLGKYGLTSAASVARDLQRTFHNVNIRLMVGIAGGAPARRDVRLGDVVVGCTSGEHGGVIHYQFGKNVQGRKLELTGSLNSSPRLLLAAANKLNTIHEREGHQINGIISQVLTRNPLLRRKYQCPGEQSDRLYIASFLHPHDGYSCEECCPTRGPELVARRRRKPTENNPLIHYGLIASSDQLMKDADARDALTRAKDVLCFEMEAAGLMNHFPCLVIRGVCDYSDTHKNDVWQGYAAATAAAYARELLSTLPPTITQPMPQTPQATGTGDYGMLHLSGPAQGSALIDVVAIHGFGGNATATWTDRRQALWLRDSLPKYVEHANIYSYNYDSMQAFNGNLSSLRRTASVLVEDLNRIKSDNPGSERSIIFVCHGLGGILLKETLRHAQMTTSVSLINSTYGIVFLGTPQRSRMETDWSRLLTYMIDTSRRSSNRALLLDNVPELARMLTELSRVQYNVIDGCSIVSFYEAEVLEDIGRLVVPKSLAILGAPRERSIGLPANHWSLASLSTDAKDASAQVHAEIRTLATEALTDSFDKNLSTTLVKKLYCLDYETILANIPEAMTGTGRWLFDAQPYREWQSSEESRILYLRGPPGFGKSVTAAKLVHDFKSGKASFSSFSTSKQCAVAYYFFGKASTKANSVAYFLRSLLHQLLQQCPSLAQPIQNHLESAANDHGRTRPGQVRLEAHQQIEPLWKALEGALAFRLSQPILLVIDALDEIGDRDLEEVASKIMKITREHASTHVGEHVKILLVSRPHELIARQLWNYNYVTWEKEVLCLDMQEDEMSADVKAFLDVAVTDYGEENGFPYATTSKIIDAILNRAGGMFLWAHLAFEDFKKGVVIWKERIIQQRLDELQKLPPGIEALYENLISKIDPAAWKEIKLLVTNLLIAPHPLTCYEAGQMLGIHGDEVNTDEIDAPFSVQQIIATHCPTLLIINPGGIIQFVHLSLQEYMWKTQQQSIQRLHCKVAEMCVHYLSLEDVRSTAIKDAKTDDTTDCLLQGKRFGFYKYASTCLDYHMRHVPFDQDTWLKYAKMAAFYDAFHVARESDHKYHSGPRRWGYKAPFYCVPTPLTTILELGAVDLIRKFADIGYNLEEKWTFLWSMDAVRVTTAMHRYVGNTAILQELLSSGMSPRVTDSNDRTPLHVAARGRRIESLRILLSSDKTDVNAQDTEGKTALHYEAANSTTSIILSDRRVNVAITDKQRRTAIAVAAFWGNFAMVSNMTQRLGSGRLSYQAGDLSPLVAAAQQDWKDMTMGMLDKVTDINLHRSYNGRNVVHIAVRNGWIDVAEKALHLGVDVNATDNMGKTALHHAAELGNFQMVRDLIRLGATARIQDRLGRTPVHAAAVEGYADTLLPLMQQSDYDINAVDHQRRSIVHWVATCDYARIVRLAIEHADADLRKRDYYGRTALHTAAICGCPNAIRVLLDSNEYIVSDVDRFGNTLLHLAARSGSLSSLQILLPELELHRGRVNHWGQTALDVAHTYNCSPETIQLLANWGLRRQIKNSTISKRKDPSYGADAKWYSLQAGNWNAVALVQPRENDREDPYNNEDRRTGRYDDSDRIPYRRRERYGPESPRSPSYDDRYHDDRYYRSRQSNRYETSRGYDDRSPRGYADYHEDRSPRGYTDPYEDRSPRDYADYYDNRSDRGKRTYATRDYDDSRSNPKASYVEKVPTAGDYLNVDEGARHRRRSSASSHSSSQGRDRRAY